MGDDEDDEDEDEDEDDDEDDEDDVDDEDDEDDGDDGDDEDDDDDEDDLVVVKSGVWLGKLERKYRDSQVQQKQNKTCGQEFQRQDDLIGVQEHQSKELFRFHET